MLVVKVAFPGAFRQHPCQKGRQSGYDPPFQALVGTTASIMMVAPYVFLGGAGSYDAVDHIA
jgi:hypothetical protein